MAKTKKLLSEDTIIVWNAHPLSEYRAFMHETIGKEKVDSLGDLSKWLFEHAGKTLKDAVIDIQNNYVATNIDELLSEKRCSHLSADDKAFISGFDKTMNELGFDCETKIVSGTAWSPMMIAYGKIGTKSRPCPTRIYLKEDGTITVRLYLNGVNKHAQYIENAPSVIKNLFAFEGGDCMSCNSSCMPGKVYTIGGQAYQKCNHSTFYFNSPSAHIMPDIQELLAKFFPVKKK